MSNELEIVRQYVLGSLSVLDNTNLNERLQGYKDALVAVRSYIEGLQAQTANEKRFERELEAMQEMDL